MSEAKLLQVTYLELVGAPLPAASRRGGAGIRLETLPREDYLALYRRVGGPLNWDTRLKMPAAELDALLGGAGLHLFVLREASGEAVGFCEFGRRAFPDIELKHFGVVPEAQGRGLGSWLLRAALAEEWATGAERIWLHTDTWDHPAAVPVYERAGFRVYDIRYEPPDLL